MVFRNGFDDNIAGLSFYNSYFLSDLNGDNRHDFKDFNAFADAFDEANGTGGFAAMIAGIPEPSSMVLSALGVLEPMRTRVRVQFPGLARVLLLVALAFNLLLNSSAPATELVKYQFNTNFNNTSGNNRHGVPHAGEIFGRTPRPYPEANSFSPVTCRRNFGRPAGAANPFGGEADYTIEMKFRSRGSTFNPALGLVLFGSANAADPNENSNHSLSVFVDPQAAGGAARRRLF